MANVSVLNTDAGVSGKTLITAEGSATQTGLLTYDRDPNPPFAVSAGSAVVANLLAERATTADGPTSGQFAFPAAQNASTNVNTLDDYEEGTFTPTITSSGGAGSPTYTLQSGLYTKVGKLVQFSLRITISSKVGLPAGNVLIGGIPFAGATTTGHPGGGVIPYWGGLAAGAVYLGCFMSSAASNLNIYFTAAAATGLNPLTVADIANPFDIIIHGTYQATA